MWVHVYKKKVDQEGTKTCTSTVELNTSYILYMIKWLLIEAVIMIAVSICIE